MNLPEAIVLASIILSIGGLFTILMLKVKNRILTIILFIIFILLFASAFIYKNEIYNFLFSSSSLTSKKFELNFHKIDPDDLTIDDIFFFKGELITNPEYFTDKEIDSIINLQNKTKENDAYVSYWELENSISLDNYWITNAISKDSSIIMYFSKSIDIYKDLYKNLFYKDATINNFELLFNYLNYNSFKGTFFKFKNKKIQFIFTNIDDLGNKVTDWSIEKIINKFGNFDKYWISEQDQMRVYKIGNQYFYCRKEYSNNYIAIGWGIVNDDYFQPNDVKIFTDLKFSDKYQ